MASLNSLLEGLDLGYLTSRLHDLGVDEPEDLVELNIRDLGERLGITSISDRKKMFYLIERLKSAIELDSSQNGSTLNTSSSTEEGKKNSKDDQSASFETSTVKDKARQLRRRPQSAQTNSQAPDKGSSRRSSIRDRIRKAANDTVRSKNVPQEDLETSSTVGSSKRSVSPLHYASPGLRGKGQSKSRGDTTSSKQRMGLTRPQTANASLPDRGSRNGKTSRKQQQQQPQRRRQREETVDDDGALSDFSESQEDYEEGEEEERKRGGRYSDDNGSTDSASRRLNLRERVKRLSGDSSVNSTDSEVSLTPPPPPPLSGSSDSFLSEQPYALLRERRRERKEEEHDDYDDGEQRQQQRAPSRPRFDEMMDAWANNPDIEDMQVRVVVRKRPLSRAELETEADIMRMRDETEVVIREPKTKVDLSKTIHTHTFLFDNAFSEQASTESIYRKTLRHLVARVFLGYRASCFAYGQTGSGKTFTMLGSEGSSSPGLFALAARDLFYLASAKVSSSSTASSSLPYQVFVSSFELYQGKLFDLLNNRHQVKCLDNKSKQAHILNLTEHRVETFEQLMGLMDIARSMRVTGETGVHADSSRSHAIIRLLVKNGDGSPLTAPIDDLDSGDGGSGSTSTPSRKGNGSKRGGNTHSSMSQGGTLTFIDLAGSERGSDTSASSKIRRQEGAEINTSLLALKEVMRSLEKKGGHTSFRGSLLTRVLKDSLIGRGARSVMIACVTPSLSNCEHTLNTLRYADRVKSHRNHLSRERRQPGQSSQEGSSLPPRPRTAGSSTPTRQRQVSPPRQRQVSPPRQRQVSPPRSQLADYSPMRKEIKSIRGSGNAHKDRNNPHEASRGTRKQQQADYSSDMPPPPPPSSSPPPEAREPQFGRGRTEDERLDEKITAEERAEIELLRKGWFGSSEGQSDESQQQQQYQQEEQDRGLADQNTSSDESVEGCVLFPEVEETHQMTVDFLSSAMKEEMDFIQNMDASRIRDDPEAFLISLESLLVLVEKKHSAIQDLGDTIATYMDTLKESEG